MTTRLKIDFSSGQLEVEGSEDLVKEIYSDFKKELNKIPIKKGGKTKEAKPKSSNSNKTSKSKSKTRSKSPSDSPSLVSDLNLYPKNELSLKEFVGQYKSPKKREIYLLCIHYLNEVLKLDSVTIDHLYTCLKELKKKVPSTLRQQMFNLSNREGWIDTSNTEKIIVTIKGENQISHYMEKQVSEE